jgi:thioredoxin-like negative regulator of GroEL
VDVDKEPALAKEFGVRGIPVLKVFKNGEVVGELAGVNSQRRIEAMLDKHLAE